ncbi:MAG: amino acid permease [Rickettsiaceae bacterium]|nr:MAG: amino acid permease [Rickettsiaceae bacterium]
MSNKIGFWSVFALVTGSQIGTGVFMLPASLAPFGKFGLVGWAISSSGAIALALIFAKLCSKFPKTGGPHVYVKEAFGEKLAFFVGWTYWLISWVSTTAVVITAVTYLAPFIGNHSKFTYLALEIILLISVTALNLKGIKAAGVIEVLLTLLKFIPLLLISIISLCYFNSENIVVAQDIQSMPMGQVLGRVTLLTLWGFIGLESATTPASSVENPHKTIPKAIVLGTISVAILYFINSVALMGLIPAKVLESSKAPYVDAAGIIFGGNWYLLISFIAAVICVGTLNAWIVASSQIALGLAEDGLMPKIFANKNQKAAPIFGIISSCVGIIPLLILTSTTNISQQITNIVNFSVTAFLFIYLICCCAFIKLIKMTNEDFKLIHYLCGIIAISFCSWIIIETSATTLLIASLFSCSGLPLYFLWYKKQIVNVERIKIVK